MNDCYGFHHVEEFLLIWRNRWKKRGGEGGLTDLFLAGLSSGMGVEKVE